MVAVVVVAAAAVVEAVGVDTQGTGSAQISSE
jgi:hypothetical protein